LFRSQIASMFPVKRDEDPAVVAQLRQGAADVVLVRLGAHLVLGERDRTMAPFVVKSRSAPGGEEWSSSPDGDFRNVVDAINPLGPQVW